MKCFYCPQKDEPVVPWDSLSPDDQIFLWDKYPDAGEGAVCDLCIRSARPSSFFSRRSLSTSSSAPQSLDSGLQLPSAPLVVSGAATPLATESVEPGVVEPSASGAESSTAATGSTTVSDGPKVRAKPLRPDTPKHVEMLRMETPIFSARQVTKNEKKSAQQLNLHLPTACQGYTPLDHCLALPYAAQGSCRDRKFGCRSELHTHPAHEEMQMASLCALILFWQALFVHGKPIFSARQVTKIAKKNSGP